MDFSVIFFVLIGALSLAAAFGVVVSGHPVHSALFLLAHFAMLAVLYITLEAEFLAAVQVIVYAGGIVILILFVIMLIGSEKIESQTGVRSWTPYVATGLGLLLLGTLASSLMGGFPGTTSVPGVAGGIPEAVGMELFTKYILQFELVSVLLLVALLGALLIARHPKTEAN